MRSNTVENGNRTVELSRGGFGSTRERLVVGPSSPVQEKFWDRRVVPPVQENSLVSRRVLAVGTTSFFRLGKMVSQEIATRDPSHNVHEWLNGFEQPQFREYMGFHSTDGVPPGHLLHLSDEMRQGAAVHPLVESAAGWSAVSAALHRSRRPERPDHEFSSARRLDALDTAEGRWILARDRIRELRERTFDPEQAAELLGWESRVQQGIAYLPNLRVAARWFGGEKVPGEEVAQAISDTRRGLLSLAQRTIGVKSTHESIQYVKAGIFSEITTGLLPLDDPKGRILMLPATMQQDHHIIPARRADLVAVSAGPGHPSGLVQVTHRGDVLPEERFRMNVRSHSDLTLDGERDSFPTLKAILTMQSGNRMDSDKVGNLERVGRRLTHRLHTYVSKRFATS
jgi:hypothetical protein